VSLEFISDAVFIVRTIQDCVVVVVVVVGSRVVVVVVVVVVGPRKENRERARRLELINKQ
jgi:NADH:ubiquinone oxidoreductase subunit 3 (subunit A)